MVYKFRDGRGYGVPAQVAGEQLEKIRLDHAGELHPQDVVDDARPEESPLHEVFEWDDAIAGENWRKDQAGHLIRSVRVVEEAEFEDQEDRKVIAYVSVRSPETKRSTYVTTTQALSNEDFRSQMIADVIRQLVGIRKRHDDLTELASVFHAIDQVAEGIAV